jgi:hypothetical protein
LKYSLAGDLARLQLKADVSPSHLPSVQKSVFHVLLHPVQGRVEEKLKDSINSIKKKNEKTKKKKKKRLIYKNKLKPLMQTAVSSRNIATLCGMFVHVAPVIRQVFV